MPTRYAKPLWTLVLLTFLASCSSFQPAGYNLDSRGTIQAVDQDGNHVPEFELMDKNARIWTVTNDRYEGKIIAITGDTVTISLNFPLSALEENKTETLTLYKTDIKKMELEWGDQGKSTVLFLTLTGLAAIFYQYIAILIWAMMGGPGMN